MSICGEPDGGPTKYGVAIVDVCTGMLASNSILAALNARHRTGKGQKVELSLYETSLAMLINVASNYLTAGRNAGRFGNGHPSIVPYTTYQAADAMIAIGIGNERQFGRIAEVLGHPEWAKDPRFTSNRARVENRDVIDGFINEALSHDDADAWLDKLKAVGVPCGRINSVADALDDPHTAARDMIETVEHSTIGALKMLGIPFKFSDTACSVRRAPPTLGAAQRRDPRGRARPGREGDRGAAPGEGHLSTDATASVEGNVMITGLNHVSIVVPDIAAAARQLSEKYGLAVGPRLENAEQGVRLAYVELGAARIELIEPSRPDSPIAKFLERNPNGGIHHFCLGVDDVDATVGGLAKMACASWAAASRSTMSPASALRSSIPAIFSGALVEIEEHTA